MELTNGGPAFPTTKPLESWGDPNAGMTLRDYFAAKAMLGMFVSRERGSKFDADQLAGFSYTMADAMLAARSA